MGRRPSDRHGRPSTAFHVEGYEKIDFSLLYVDGAFAVGNTEIADRYRPYGRCLMVVDETVHDALRRADRTPTSTTTASTLTVVRASRSRETEKSLATLERIVDAFGDVRAACARSRCWSSAAA